MLEIALVIVDPVQTIVPMYFKTFAQMIRYMLALAGRLFFFVAALFESDGSAL
jgi:hypothetical protein